MSRRQGTAEFFLRFFFFLVRGSKIGRWDSNSGSERLQSKTLTTALP